MYFLLGRLLRNFITRLLSSITCPRAADLYEISDSFPAKISILYESFILILSNLVMRGCKRASLTRSAPMLRDLTASRIPFEVSCLPTYKIRDSMIA